MHGVLKRRKEEPKNWNDLPPELKRMCVKRMDIDTRLELRLTAKTEQKLVDSLKLKFSLVVYCYSEYDEEDRRYGFTSNFDCRAGLVSVHVLPNLKGIGKAMRLFGYVFKHHDFDEFRVSGLSDFYWQPLLHQLVEHGPMRVQSLDVKAGVEVTKTLLENCDPDRIERIKLNLKLEGFEHWLPARRFVDDDEEEAQKQLLLTRIPAFYRANCIELQQMSCSSLPGFLAEKWLEMDAPIGTRLYIPTRDREIAGQLRSILDSSIIENTADDIRIGTGIPGKQIVVNRRLLMSNSVIMLISESTQGQDEYKKFLESDDCFDSFRNRLR